MALAENALHAAAPAAPALTPSTHGAAALPHGIGAALPWLEDARLLTGSGRFADDVNVPGDAWGYALRSQVAHALIKRIDASAALEVEGLIAVLTGDDYRCNPAVREAAAP